MHNFTRYGRPLVILSIGGKKLQCFIDTGSSASLIKKSAISMINVASRSHKPRQLVGVNGTLLNTLEERDVDVRISGDVSVVHRYIVVNDCPFPGQVLLGMDFLRRFTYTLHHKYSHTTADLYLQGVRFPVTFTDAPSLAAAPVHVKSIANVNVKELFTTPASPCVRVRHSTIVPPQSGRFIPATLKHNIEDGSDVLVEGHVSSVLVPRSIIRVRDRLAHIWVVNIGIKPVKLRAGNFLSEVEVVTDVQPDQVATAAYVDTGEGSHGKVDEEVSMPSLDHLTTPQRNRLRSVLESYKVLFDSETSVGTVPGIYHSIHTGDAAPVRTKQWRLPQIAKQVIKDECQKMLKSGVIEPSISPWLSPIVLVRKKDQTFRFCIDFRNVNSLTMSDSYALPLLDELIDELGKSKVFSVFDARSAYWSIELNPDDKAKTAFSDGTFLWQFRRMPYGLKTAGATYQRMVNFILSPVLGKHTMAYLDDIVVHSSCFDQHVNDVNETLKLLTDAGFKLNPSKCNVAVSQLKLLGFIVSESGVAPDPDKVKSINEMPAPRNVKEVRRFLGMCSFFRRHIKGFASIAAPLSSLTRKDKTFAWDESCNSAFNQLKQALITAPVLRRPDFSQPFEIHSDASGVAIGGCLIQREDNNPHPVAYFSRKLRGPEVRYSAVDAEALAVVEAVRAFNPYIYGRKFEIFTDHRALCYIFKRPTKCARMTRWSHELASYDCKVTYKQGAVHCVPDALSRAIAAIDLTAVDTQQFRDLQLNDPLCRQLIEFLEGKALPRAKIKASLDEFELKDGIAYHVRDLPSGLVSQLVLPPAVRKDAMKIVHSSSTAGHPGIFRTYKRLQDFYWFPNALQYCRKYVESCATCQRRKAVQRGRAPLASTPLATEPFERVNVDLVMLPTASNGDKYVLTIVDELTRFVQLVPLASKDVHTVADALLLNFSTLFGPPVTLISDNGSEFTGEYFREVCSLMGTKIRYTTPYCPASNGLVERSNRVIKDCLSALCEDAPDTWNTRLEYVRLALNTSFHRSVNNQPLYLLTGRSCTFPIGMTNHHTRDGKLGQRQLDLLAARDAAVTGTQQVREANMEALDRRVRAVPELSPGVMVLRKRPPGQGGSGLASRWLGPLRIIKKVGPVSYILRDIAKQTEHRVHRNQIVPFRVDEELELVTPDGVDQPTPDDIEPDPDDPVSMLLLSLVRSPDQNIS